MFLLLPAWKSVWELVLSLHCFWGAGPPCLWRRLLPVRIIQNARQFISLFFSSPDGCRVEDEEEATDRVGDPSWLKQVKPKRMEHDLCILWTPVLCLGTVTWCKVGRWPNGWGRSGMHLWGQSNPHLRAPPPEPPQTHFLVAWSTPRRNSPETGWGAALLLHCEGSGPRLGRSKKVRTDMSLFGQFQKIICRNVMWIYKSKQDRWFHSLDVEVNFCQFISLYVCSLLNFNSRALFKRLNPFWAWK